MKHTKGKCIHLNEVGKCLLKVPVRYNDLCNKDDCPLNYKNKSKRLVLAIKKATDDPK